MRAMSRFPRGFLALMAVAGLFVVSSGFAADTNTRQHSKDVKVGAVSGNSSETSTQQWQVADQNGNIYLLIPLETYEGKVTVEYVFPYTRPMSH